MKNLCNPLDQNGVNFRLGSATIKAHFSKILCAIVCFCILLFFNAHTTNAQTSIFYDVPPCAVGQGPQMGKLLLLGTTGGVGPYVYTISSGQSFDYINNCFSGLVSGTYTITTTDNIGSVLNIVASVGAAYPEIFVTAIVTTAPSCVSNNAAACVSATGGTGSFTFKWFLNGQLVATGACPSTLSPGNYTVLAQDNGCSCAGYANLLITAPQLQVTSTMLNSNCASANCDGELDFIMSGSAPYSFNWSSGGISSSIESNNTVSFSNLCPGYYSGSVTDANGCGSLIQETVLLDGADVVPNVSTGSTLSSLLTDWVDNPNHIHYINSNTTWNAAFFNNQNEILVDATVIVKPGVTLTVSGLNLLITPHHGIRVLPGAFLYGSGSTFDAGCGTTWRGFEVLGDCANSQEASLTLDECVVTHAETGILNFMAFYPIRGNTRYFGGTINCSTTKFIDNVFDLWLRNDSPVSNTQFVASFSDCEFTLNVIPNNTEITYDVTSNQSARILLANVSGLRFSNCTILNNNLTYQSSTGSRVQAIYSRQSSFGFRGNPSVGNDPNGYTSAIEGFRIGIQSLGAFSTTGSICNANGSVLQIAVSNTRFSNFQDIDATNPITFFCSGNYFGPVLPGYSSDVNPAGGANFSQLDVRCTGAGLSSPTIFQYNNNYHYHNSTDQSSKIIGLYALNLGSTNNFIWGNYFEGFSNATTAVDNVTTAIFLRDINRGDNVTSGLHYECNTFNNNVRDIYISCPAGLGTSYGPSRTQGHYFPAFTAQSPTGNSFKLSFDATSNPTNSLAFNKNDDIGVSANFIGQQYSNYVYNFNYNELSSANGTHELSFNLMNPISMGNINPCFGQLDHLNNNQLLVAVLNRTNSYNNIKADYFEILDNGDHLELLQEVKTMTFNNALNLFDKLLQASPELSEETIIAAIEKEFELPKILLKIILSSNSKTKNSDEIKISLIHRSDPFTSSELSEILSDSPSTSASQIFDYELGVIESDRSNLLTEIIRRWGLGEIGEEELMSVVEESNFLLDRFFQVQIAYGRGNTELAASLMESTTEYFSIAASVDKERQNLAQLIDAQCRTFHAEPENVSEADLNLLWGNIDSEFELNRSIAGMTLEILGLFDYFPIELIEDETENRMYTTQSNFTCCESGLSLYPNPATNMIVLDLGISYHLDCSYSIVNTLGVEVISGVIRQADNQVVIDLREFDSGVYFLKLVSHQNQKTDVYQFIKI